MTIFDVVKFDERGLVPAVVQDYRTGRVLMLAYMNRESLCQTLETGRACYWSRSRQRLWVKGETSGNFQEVKGIAVDCDGDTILLRVKQMGWACHTGYLSCFYREIVEGEKLEITGEKASEVSEAYGPPKELPDQAGRFGPYGGRFVPETLMSALEELEEAYYEVRDDRDFHRELDHYLRDYAGRPTPLYFAERLTAELGGAKIYLKREDLAHTGAHKINNTLGQILLAQRMGKNRIIAETGAGQHGVATATVAAKFGLKCIIYMGEEDMERQALNVFRMRLLGAEVVPVSSGSKTLKDAINEAIRDWVTNVRDTFYIIGSVVGPHPYPMMVRDFQSVIGRETKEQILVREDRLPDYLIACVGGGSNSLGLFSPFLDDQVELIGVEAAGLGINTDRHAASLCRGEPGVLHGAKGYILQDGDGQIRLAHSIAAGLDYPGVGPEHSYFKDTGRARYVAVTDQEAVEAFQLLSRLEGIIPALESAHALAYAIKLAPQLDREQIVVICLSGRGDKDVQVVAQEVAP